MHDTSKGCILWFCLILFFSVDLVEWKCCISSLLAWLCVGENPGGRSLAAEPESPEAELNFPRFYSKNAPGSLLNWQTLGISGSTFMLQDDFFRGERCLLYTSFMGRWHMIQWFSSSCLPPAVRSLESHQRIHEKNSMAWWKLQGKLRKGRRTNRKRWEVFQ